MKRIAGVLVALALVSAARAETVGFQFRDVTVAAFLDTVVRGILGRDYVMAGGVGGDQKINVAIKGLEKDRALEVATAALASVGLRVVEKAGVLFVEQAGVPGASMSAAPAVAGVPAEASAPAAAPVVSELAAPDVVEVYRPRHRSSEFLAQVAKLAGGKVIEAKGRSDVLVYGVAEDRRERLQKLLADADGPVNSINVRAAVLEVSDGSDASRSFQGVLSLLGGHLGMSVKLGKIGDQQARITGTNLQAVLSAVEGDNRFRYVAEPRLRVLDGEKAKLTVGQDVPVRGAVTQAANGAQLQAVEYRTAGVVLTLTPSIYADSVQMRVAQQVSSVTTNSSSGIDSPVILRREAETTVEAKAGEVVMLAGMDESQESNSRNGVPWLPSFLDATTAKRSRSQIVVLLEVERI